MSTAVTVPNLGADDVSVSLLAWHVAVGDTVEAGQLIAEFESDKTIVEFQAEVGGTVTALLVPQGAEGIRAGDSIAEIDAGHSSATSAVPVENAVQPPAPCKPEPQPEPTVDVIEVPDTTSVQQSVEGTASALAGAIARQQGQSLDATTGSGPNGRIMARDLGVNAPPDTGAGNAQSISPVASRMLEMTGRAAEAYHGTGPSGRLTAHDIGVGFAQTEQTTGATADADALSIDPGLTADIPHHDEPATRLRKVIAQRLTSSKRDAPDYTMTVSINASRMLAWRKALNEERDEASRVSVNDIMIRMVVHTLKKEPALNVSWLGDQIRHFQRIDISVAVSTDRGLVTPVLRDAGVLDIDGISGELKRLVDAARSGQLSNDDLSGGTFTISNLGMFDVDDFAPIINPPQAAILGIGSARIEAVPVSDDADSGTTNQPVMRATLAVDHRAADGTDGARFLGVLKQVVEDPRRLLL